MKLSKDFLLNEFTDSIIAKSKGIKNEPDGAAIANLRNLCVNVLQPVRDGIEKTIRINSGYRCEELNKAVGGVPTSQHVKGQASDIHVDGMSARELFNFIVSSGLEFDQIILYPTFVHVSYNEGHNRRQVLYAKGVKP